VLVFHGLVTTTLQPREADDEAMMSPSLAVRLTV